jgi:hypothetical protein
MSLLCSLTKYELPCDRQLLHKSRTIALGEVGVRETGQNRGDVAKYLKAIGLSGGYSYCAAGVYWCFDSSAVALGLSKSAIPIAKTGVANEMLNDAMKRGTKISRRISENDLLVWKSKRSWNGHIERVIKVQDKGIVQTVGFNVRLPDGEEGVAIKTRFLNHRLGRMFLRGIITFKETER